VTSEQLDRIFRDDEPEVLEKFFDFRSKKILEGNPMARFCPQPDCGGHMIAESLDARKMKCPKCDHAICFRCREDWHGYCTSCESAIEKNFEGG